ncbi:MAG: mechanosensitive ion channel [Rhodocyclaceae bacterium]|nr:mechanosensitive ion channel [Rhodocyclaceae bacterium]
MGRSNRIRLVRLILVAMAAWPAVGHPQDVGSLLGSAGGDGAESPARVIDTDSTKAQDARIRQRLAAIFREVAGLEAVSVEVHQGVVDLGGKVPSPAQAQRAIRFAGQVEGVVEVESAIEVDRDLERRLLIGWQALTAAVGRLISNLPLLLAAVSLVVLAWWLGRALSRHRGWLERLAPNPFIAVLVGQALHLLLVILGLVAALVLFDATALIGTVLGAAGIVGLALGFAVRDTVENSIASLLLSIRNPFEANDYVAIDGFEGNVLRMTARATILLSPDGNHVRIPNAKVFKAVIVNYTRRPERRFRFDIGVDTDLDLLPVQSLAMESLSAVPGVLVDPPPMVVVDALGDSNVVLSAYGWMDQRSSSYLKVRSEAIRAVKQSFDEAGVVMPEPIYKLRVIDAAGAASASDATADLDRAGGHDRRMQDVSADRSLEARVHAEQRAGNEQNLLSPQAPREL